MSQHDDVPRKDDLDALFQTVREEHAEYLTKVLEQLRTGSPESQDKDVTKDGPAGFGIVDPVRTGDRVPFAEEDETRAASTVPQAGQRSLDEPLVQERPDVMEAGDICGPFRIEAPLGRGGMGAVYVAGRRDDLDQRVALKTLASWQPGMRALFRKECRILSGLRHPNITQLIDAGHLPNGQPWLAMEYLEGQTLNEYVEKHNPQLKARLKLFLQVCDGTSYAHQQMIIHRDLKPTNIVVQPSGVPKILDFGLASHIDPLTGEQQTATVMNNGMMTPAYASPEQVNGDRLTAVSDVYCLGVILYELLTGARPYDFKIVTPTEIHRVVTSATIQKPSRVRLKTIDGSNSTTGQFARQLPGDLDTIVLKALERQPERRYGSVEAMAQDIRHYLNGETISARPATLRYRFGKFVRRNPWPTTLIATVLLFLISFSAYVQRQRTLIGRERDQVRLERASAEQVSDFLVSMFEQMDPDVMDRGEVSAWQVVENGRRSMESSLRDQPRVNAKLSTSLSRVYRSMGRYDEALEMLQGVKGGVPLQEFLAMQVERVRVHMSLGEYDKADAWLADLELRDEKEPQFSALLQLLRAQLTYLKGSYREAQRLLDTSPAWADALSEEQQLSLIQLRSEVQSGLGNYEQAVSELRALLGRRRALHGEDHSLVANTWSEMGLQYLKLHQLDEAARRFAEAETIYRKVFGAKHPIMIQVHIHKSMLHSAREAYDAAQEDLEKALALCTQHLDEDHPQWAYTWEHLAALRKIQARYGEAERLYRQSLTLARSHFGEDHPLVSETLNNIGEVYYLQSDFEQAETYFREALTLDRKNLGESHPHVGSATNNLAMMLTLRGKFDEAISLFEKADVVLGNSLGEENPHYTSNLANWSMAYSYQGDYVTSQEYLERALALRIAHSGEVSDAVAGTLGNLAVIAQRQGDFAKAANFNRRAIEVRSELLGEDHPTVAIHRANLGDLLMLKGDFAEAAAQYDLALEHRIKQFGEDHTEVAFTQMKLGQVRRLQGQFEPAETQLQAAIASQQAVNNQSVLQMAYFHLGRLYDVKGVSEKAVATFRKALTYQQDQVQMGPMAALIRGDLGIALLQKGDLQQAEPLLDEAIAFFTDKTGYERHLMRYYSEKARLDVARGNLATVEPLYERHQALAGKMMDPSVITVWQSETTFAEALFSVGAVEAVKAFLVRIAPHREHLEDPMLAWRLARLDVLVHKPDEAVQVLRRQVEEMTAVLGEHPLIETIKADLKRRRTQ